MGRKHVWIGLVLVLGVALVWFASTASRPSDRVSPAAAAQQTAATHPDAPHDETPHARDLGGTGSRAADAASGRSEAANADAPPAEHKPADSLDDADWPVVERRITAAVAFARDVKGVHVSPELLDRLQEGGDVDVTIELASGFHSVDDSLAGTRHDAPFYLKHVPFTQVRVGPQALENLLRSSRTGSVSVSLWAAPSLAETIPLVGADVAHDWDAEGEGLTVVVVDTGVETDHPFFAGRIVDGHCFSSGALCPGGSTIATDSIAAGDACESPTYDCEHGTGVAGAAVGAAGSRVGVAPAASLISIMAASPLDEGNELGFTSTDLVRALEQVYDQRNEYAIASVNLSLGTDPVPNAACQDLQPSFNAVLALLRDAEIAVVAAAGNEGESEDGKRNLSWPACVDGVVSVGATTKDDEVVGFSNSSSRLDLLAPGVGVRTSNVGGGYASVSGTSIAAPHVAGAFATIRSVYPDEQADRILLALRISGQSLRDDANGVTASRIDVAAAIVLIEDGDLRWDHEKVYDEVFDGPSKCGLIGVEMLLPIAALSLARMRRARRSAR